MEKPIIYIHESFSDTHIQEIKDVATQYLVVTSEDELAQLNKDTIQIMLGWNKKLGNQLLHSTTSQLKWVQSISAGVDSFDLSQFQKKGVLLSNGSGIHSISIAEHVFGVLLSETRGIRTSIQQQHTHSWEKNNISYQQLSGQKLLIVGTGQIGQQIAQVAQGIGLQTYGINTTGHVTAGFIECYSQEKLSRVVKEIDIVVNILPLTESTYYLYNNNLFSVMKKETIFVNVGRGPSVNTEDLIEALLTGQIKFAALDVFEEEPLSVDNPLWQMENVLITPHISGATPKFKAKLLAIFLPNLKSFIENSTLIKNEISFDNGY